MNYDPEYGYHDRYQHFDVDDSYIVQAEQEMLGSRQPDDGVSFTAMEWNRLDMNFFCGSHFSLAEKRVILEIGEDL